MSRKDQFGFYSNAVNVAEKERLETSPYPHQISKAILDRMTFRSLIDACSGPDIKLAEYVCTRRSKYIAFDSGKAMIDGEEKSFASIMKDELKKQHIPGRVYQADVCDIPSEVGSADVVHQRFVLMHLSHERRHLALESLLSRADRKLILLEYSWRAVKSTKHGPEMLRFTGMSFDLMRAFQIDPFAGETMQGLVSSTLKEQTYRFERFLRPEGDYTPELIQLCRVQSGFADKIGRTDLVEGFLALAEQFERTPITFVPAEIVAAIISTN